MCYITEAGKSVLGVFVMLDEAGISALRGLSIGTMHSVNIGAFDAP